MAPATNMEDSNATGTSEIPTRVFSFTEADAGRLLGDAQTAAKFLNMPSIMDVKRKFEYESKRQVTLDLHLLTLIEYHRNQRIPRGMRGQLRPNMFAQDMEFCDLFEKISNKYSYDLILLNVQFLRKELLKGTG